MIKRLAIAAAATIAVAVGLLAAPASASAPTTTDDPPSTLGSCSFSASKPVLAGGTIFAYAPWRCDMARSEVTVTYVEIFRDGSRVKHAKFSRYGPFSVTYATGIPCITGVHTYKVRTYGYSGDGPTSWLPKDSPTFTTTSGRCR